MHQRSWHLSVPAPLLPACCPAVRSVHTICHPPTSPTHPPSPACSRAPQVLALTCLETFYSRAGQEDERNQLNALIRGVHEAGGEGPAAEHKYDFVKVLDAVGGKHRVREPAYLGGREGRGCNAEQDMSGTAVKDGKERRRRGSGRAQSD